MKRWLILLGVGCAAGIVGVGGPVGTAFSYQGHLTEGGLPVEGSYDLQFARYAEAVGGVPAGSMVTNLAVTVVNGLFTTTVDFGASVFTGTDWWLEIGVRRAGTPDDFTVLTPRQELGAVPNALYARRAGEAEVAGFATSLPWFGLIGVPPGFADGVDHDTLYGAGAGLSLAGTTFSIAAGGVGATQLADGAVTGPKLADASVDRFKLQMEAVTLDKLNTGGSTSGAVVLYDGTNTVWRRVGWTELTDIPAGLADGVDNDTVYQAGAGLSLAGTTFGIAAGGVGATQLADGAVGTAKLAGRAVTPDRLGTNGAVGGAVMLFNGAGPGWQRLGWTQVDGIPAGLADGVDNDTLYSAGSGLALLAGEFSLQFGGAGVATTAARSDHDHAGVYLGVNDPASGDVSGAWSATVVGGLQGRPVGTNEPATGQVLKWTGQRWEAGEDATATGDVTGVLAGEGLSGGGAAGELSLAVVFGGSGQATTVARSDHDHEGVYAVEGHAHSGFDITSGTVASARIDATLARDTEVFPIVLANDGAGSGLDADRVDGLHASAFWQLDGNGQTTAGTHFLGTTDDRPLEFRANDVPVMRLGPGRGVAVLTNAGPSTAVAIGERYRDNGLVAWARVGSDGTLQSEFGVASASRVSTGVYQVTLNASAQDAAHLIPVVNARLSAPPNSAETVRIPSVNPVTGGGNVFEVYINNGAYALVDNEFVVMVTAR